MIWELARFRIALLLRQKIMWVSLSLAFGIALFSYLFASLSFVQPVNVFWDLGLSALFLLCSFLAIFLGAFIFYEERKTRTLEWMLTLKVSRTQWLLGNFFGFSFSLLIVSFVGTCLMFLFSTFFFNSVSYLLVLQASLLGLLESCLILAMALFLGFVLRPLLASFFLIILFVFLHSQDSLRLILTDPISGRFVESRGLSVMLQFARFLPPLQWFDLRTLVGFQEALPLLNFAGITLTALLWTLLCLVFGKIYFDRMDL